MSKLIHIQSSPRGSHSTSQLVAKKFLAEYQRSHPNDEIETLDLWQIQLPEISAQLLEACYAAKQGLSLSSEQEAEWQQIVAISEQFQSADKFLLSAPMWNFSIPYKLKHYIDLLVQSGLTFSYSPEEGFRGLITGKRMAAIYTRGGAYGPGTGFENYDLQSPYIRQVFGFIGITDIEEIIVEPTAIDEESKNKIVSAAANDAAEIARKF